MGKSSAPRPSLGDLDLLCVFAAEIMGLDHLRDLPALLSGHRSIESVMPAEAALAARHLRLKGLAPRSLEQIHVMRRHREATGEAPGTTPRYRVSPKLVIERLWGEVMPTDVAKARAELIEAPALRRHARPLTPHNPAVPATAGNLVIEAVGHPKRPAPKMPMDHAARMPGRVYWSELVAIADQFDHMDVTAGRQRAGQRNWYRRLHQPDGRALAELKAVTAKGLGDTDAIDLGGLRHLIGLPGSGKTTLLYLLAAWTFQRGFRACFLLPSIEVCTRFIEKLAPYGIEAALLAGRGQSTRNGHVERYARALAEDHRGYGITRTSARFFATNCALAGFTDPSPEPFPHHDPPCTGIWQDKKRFHCALAGVCGFRHSEQMLATSRLWVGHVLSTDRQIPQPYSEFALAYVEYLGRSFDLLVIDECDGAQSQIDGLGIKSLSLTGHENSVARFVAGIDREIAAGANHGLTDAGIQAAMRHYRLFANASDDLIAIIGSLPKDLRETLDGQLLTTQSLVARLFHRRRAKADARTERPGDDTLAILRRRLDRCIEQAIGAVVFERTPSSRGTPATASPRSPTAPGEPRSALFAEEHLLAPLRELITAIDRSAQPGPNPTKGIIELLRGELARGGLDEAPHFVHQVRLLVAVTLCVYRYLALEPHLPALEAAQSIKARGRDLSPSPALLAQVPASLAGRLRGIRYQSDDRGNVHIEHLDFAGVPRLLFDRWPRMGQEAGGDGPAILLTSATSMLPDSPSYHLHHKPDYLLHRPGFRTALAEASRQSRFIFSPLPDPQDESRKLRFSGGRLADRLRVLRAMACSLLDGGPCGRVEQALASHDVIAGIRRKAAFVVNSYEQARDLAAHIRHHIRGNWGFRTRYVARAEDPADRGAVTASEVERLAHDPDWDLLVFPMNAIGRATNLVFPDGPRSHHALLGTLFFLTRPHPGHESLDFLRGLVGSAGEAFDRRTFASLEPALEEWRRSRKETLTMVRKVLRLPQTSQTLGKYARPFVADQIVMILQTIGRAMRGDRPAQVYFVDAAWAPRTAMGQTDTETSSMLLMMRSILEDCLADPDPGLRACYEELYGPYVDPLRRLEGLELAQASD
jgi:hypothetical protein